MGTIAAAGVLLAVLGAGADKARPMPGQIVVRPGNPRWLVRYDPGGKHTPFFLCGPGDPEDFLYRGRLRGDGTRDGDQMKLIAKLTGTGANCIYLQAVRSHGGDGDRTHNPFLDHDPAKGLSGKVLDQWAKWFAAMDEAGIVIFLFLYDDSARIWNTGDEVGPAERQFIASLVGRFKRHKSLIWCVAEEYQERYSAKRVSRIAAAIRSADEFAHPIAVHKLAGLDFREFADDANIDQFAIQYNVKSARKLHDGVVRAWTRAAGRYNLNLSEVADHGSGAEARKRSWAGAMGGAYVMVLKMDIAGTAAADLRDCGRLAAFFESTDFQEMSPHDELAAGATEYVLARPGRSYIAYAAGGRGRVGLKGLTAGSYTFRWLDCRTGRSVVRRGVKVAAGEQAWPRPDGIGAELAVHITRAP